MNAQARVQETVQEVVSRVLRVLPDSVRPDEDLFERPEYDSLTIVVVLAEIETAFDVEIAAQWLVAEAFESVESISALVRKANANTAEDE